MITFPTEVIFGPEMMYGKMFGVTIGDVVLEAEPPAFVAVTTQV